MNVNSFGQYEDDDTGWAVCLRGGVSNRCGSATPSTPPSVPGDIGYRSLIARPDNYLDNDNYGESDETRGAVSGISSRGVSTMRSKASVASKNKRTGSSRRKRRRISESNNNNDKKSRSDPLGCPSSETPAVTVGKQITLFFPRLPAPVQDATALASIVGRPLEAIRIITRTDGQRLAWATFDNSTTCASTLSRLQASRPELGAQLHRASQSQSLSQFDKRLAFVRRNGGVGNTLLFINLPADVSCDEFSEIISRQCVHVTPLRTRTAVAGNGRGVARNFWCVFADINASRCAYESVQGVRVTFRCGLTVTLRPNIHDDSVDADESRRRSRALKLINPSADTNLNTHAMPQSQSQSLTRSAPTAIQCLENFLRSKLHRFVLLGPTTSEH